MVRVTFKSDSSVLRRKADAFEASVKSQNQAAAQANKPIPSKTEVERTARQLFEPVEPGFYQFVKRRTAHEPVLFLESKKIGRYKIDWPSMGDDLGAMEKFAGEHKLGAPVGSPQPFDRADWNEPYRMVVPQDTFEAYLNREMTSAAAPSLWHQVGVRLAIVAAVAVVTPRGWWRALAGLIKGAGFKTGKS